MHFDNPTCTKAVPVDAASPRASGSCTPSSPCTPPSTTPSSHKYIEKRRRDRINQCLAELSKIVPAAFSKQSGGKLEKAEILEMTVEYMKTVQHTEVGMRYENGEWFSCDIWLDFLRYFQAGFQDCIREASRFMSEVEGVSPNDPRTIRLTTFLHSRFRPDLASAVSSVAAASTATVIAPTSSSAQTPPICPSLNGHVVCGNQSTAVQSAAPPILASELPPCLIEQSSSCCNISSNSRMHPRSRTVRYSPYFATPFQTSNPSWNH